MFQIKNPTSININLINTVNVFQTPKYKQFIIEYDNTMSELEWMSSDEANEDLLEFNQEDYEMLSIELETTAIQIVNLLRQRLKEIENNTSGDANKERHKIHEKLKDLE